MVVAGFGAGTTGATVRRGSFGEGGCSSRVSKDPVALPLGPIPDRKGVGCVSEGHSFDRLRTGSQTPVKEASPLCTPLFISLLGKLPQIRGKARAPADCVACRPRCLKGGAAAFEPTNRLAVLRPLNAQGPPMVVGRAVCHNGAISAFSTCGAKRHCL